jgi:hypothetical protein
MIDMIPTIASASDRSGERRFVWIGYLAARACPRRLGVCQVTVLAAARLPARR